MATETKLTNTAPSAEKAPQQAHQPPVAPAVDVFENENELLVVADLPGVSQNSMSIHFEKNRLTIEGKRTPPQWAPRMAETPAADYRRTFLVPQGIDTERITADLSQGVLSVHLPKHASTRPRRIEVKGN
jgi:HSP20 family molecular chaperone IbpA